MNEHKRTDSFGKLHKIVVCKNDTVYAGEVSELGLYLLIENAVKIRQVGTKKGLGELAETGNQSKTIVDFYGTVRIPLFTVTALIDCKETIHATE